MNSSPANTMMLISSFAEAITIALLLAAILWPAQKILTRAGLNGWLAFLLLVPVANLVFLWWFAYAAWPNLKPAAQT